MAYDEKLAERIRGALAGRCEFAERKMFGGLAFMAEGKMCCGVIGDDLMVRVGPEALAEALARPHARVMDFTGRPSRNMVYVGPGGTRTARAVEGWVGRGLAFVRALPDATPRKRRRPPR
jgi:TfoX/Sxy family transcriptional regulator of competence genes